MEDFETIMLLEEIYRFLCWTSCLVALALVISKLANSDDF